MMGIAVVFLATVIVFIASTTRDEGIVQSDTARSSSEDNRAVVGTDDGTREAAVPKDTNSNLNNLYVGFPDGESVRISLVSPPKMPPYPQGPTAKNYSTLAQLASNGDHGAAFVLSNLLHGCSLAHRTLSELEHAVDQLYQTHTIPIPGSTIARTISNPDDLAIHERNLRDEYSRCSGLSLEQIDEADTWLATAADSGNLHAMMIIGQRLLGRRDPKAIDYLQMAWEGGNLTAASHLGYLYSDSRFEGANPVTGYAYKYLHDKVAEALRRQTEADYGGSRNTKTSPSGFGLSPREMEEAITLAKDILRGNRNCCFPR